MSEELSNNQVLKFSIYRHLWSMHGQWIRLVWNFLPMILVFALLIMPIGLIILEKTQNKIYKALTALDAQPLKNLPNEMLRPTPSLKKIISGEWQHQFESWAALKIPFRSAIIRMHNQIFYSLFSTSYMYLPTGITIGKEDYLFTSNLITDGFCKPSALDNKQALSRWVSEIHVLAEFFKKRGQQFVYMSTPSKASYYPEYFPYNYAISGPCRHKPYMPLADIFKKNSVTFVDAQALIMKSKQNYGHLLFPHGGLHWTMLGAALVIKDFIMQLNTSMGKHFPELQYSYTISSKETGPNADLLDLANLLWPHQDYQTPTVNISYPNFKKDKPFKLVIVGDSMSSNFVNGLSATNLFDQIDFYFYYDKRHLRSINAGNLVDLPVSEADTHATLLAADVVILEENESIRASQHSEPLFEGLLGRSSLYKPYIKIIN